MRRGLLSLSSLLLLVVGCRHANLPDLPASHGALSMAMDRYANDRESSFENYTPTPTSIFQEESQVLVEPERALSIYQDASSVLGGAPTEQQVRDAADDLKGACMAGLMEACAFLRERFEQPRPSNSASIHYPEELLLKQLYTVGVIRCRLGVSGALRDCVVLERGAKGVVESLLAYAAEVRFHPATLAGQAIELPLTLSVQFAPARRDAPMTKVLDPRLRFKWAQARVTDAPESPLAWENLAILLAKQESEVREYREALRRFQSLAPASWWAANEVAWLHVQEGRYADAAPLVKRARAIAFDNPYVLETSAAVLAGMHQCDQAVTEQRRAVEKLSPEWPAPERERFMQTLERYQRGCTAANAVSASAPGH
ncbi:tetratricopeptide repeat protein [Myxococcus sp. 1LA]